MRMGRLSNVSWTILKINLSNIMFLIIYSETKFITANQVYLHACEVHCPDGLDETICHWDRCDNMKRKRFSMMTHIYDKHCNTEVFSSIFVNCTELNVLYI